MVDKGGNQNYFKKIAEFIPDFQGTDGLLLPRQPQDRYRTLKPTEISKCLNEMLQEMQNALVHPHCKKFPC